MPKFFDEPRNRGYVKSFDGLQIHWEHFGPNLDCGETPIFFFYGLACSKHQWRSMAEIFTPERPCLFFDYRGHHKSENVEKNSDPVTFSHLARDASTVLEALNIKKTHIFAHSMGCNVALELSFNEPNLVESMILVAGSAENPFTKMLGINMLDKFVNPMLDKFSSHQKHFYTFWHWLMGHRLFLRLLVSLTGFNRKAVENHDVEIYLDSVATVSPKVFFELLRELARGTSEPLLPRIKTHTLVVSGGNDQVTPPLIQKRLAEGLENAEFFIIPLGSHNVQLEFSDYLMRRIREFWSKESPKPTIRAKREKKSKRD